jgi:hypothetical protein
MLVDRSEWERDCRWTEVRRFATRGAFRFCFACESQGGTIDLNDLEYFWVV